ncbi:MAG: enoyl-CoA hydratase/isomerase family protein [Candidatus Thorarchaeota archaeon]
MEGDIEVRRDGPIAEVTISRPEKLNSVTSQMLEKFETVISDLDRDEECAVIVFTGKGERAFSAGFDIQMIRSLRGEARYALFRRLERVIAAVRQLRNSVTIAAVNGYAVGFGAMLVSACDLRVFAQDSVFRLPEIDVGVFPGSGAACNLMYLVGPARAKDILISCRPVYADEALRIGLADRVVPHDQLRSTVEEMARGIASKSRLLVSRTKTLLNAITGLDYSASFRLESQFTEEWLRDDRSNGA